MRERKIRHAERGFGYSLFSGLWKERGKVEGGRSEGGRREEWGRREKAAVTSLEKRWDREKIQAGNRRKIPSPG